MRAKGPCFSGSRGTGPDGAQVIQVFCLRCCSIEIGPNRYPHKCASGLIVLESSAFQQEIAPWLRWTHNGQTFTQAYSTIPQSIRQPAIYRLLRQAALPNYFFETHCGDTKCGAMFSVYHQNRRISRTWTRDGPEHVRIQLESWWRYHQALLALPAVPGEFDDFCSQCEVLCEEMHLPYDFSIKNRDQLYNVLACIVCDSHVWLTANRIAIERDGERVVELRGTGPDFPWLSDK